MSDELPSYDGAFGVLPVEVLTKFLFNLLKPAMHDKRARAIARASVATMHAEQLTIASIGRGFARAFGGQAKHGIKQVDRLVGNSKFSTDDVFSQTVPWLIAERKRIVVSLDWTEYAKDGHSRVAINLITDHGRATPLVWKTYKTKELRENRNAYEDEVLMILREFLPRDVHVTLLADRGFGDIKLYEYLEEDLGWDFVIRFRANIRVQPEGTGSTTAGKLVASNGRVRGFPSARVTASKYEVGVVTVKKKDMKEAWCLATTLAETPASAVDLYQKRFTCEESFRDEKDPRFGMGSLHSTVGTTERRDRLLILSMLSTIALTLLGAAGENAGCDRELRANTVTGRRTHSLFRQGREYLFGCARRSGGVLGRTLMNLIHGHAGSTSTFALI